MLKLATQTNCLEAEGAYQVLSKAQALEKKGHKIIHFEIGQPDFPTPDSISLACIKAICEGKTKYNPPLGLPELREKIAEKVSALRDVEFSKEMVAVVPSGKTAIFAAMALTINPGDEVIYPDPGFPTYGTLIDYFGGIKKPIPLVEENGFAFDMQKFSKSFSKKTKLIIINSPSNPTGGIIPAKDLKIIAEMVKQTDCFVITDEIYSQIIYDGQKFESLSAYPSIKSKLFILDGFSKTYSMTGWRLGFVILPEKYISKMDYLLTHLVGCTATFTQYAGLEALSGSGDSVRSMVAEFENRRNYLVGELNKIPGIICQKPLGAFYAFPNIKKFGKTSKQLADICLEKAGVALLPGTAFGKYGEGYLRISYATSMENLKNGINKIKNAFKNL